MKWIAVGRMGFQTWPCFRFRPLNVMDPLLSEPFGMMSTNMPTRFALSRNWMRLAEKLRRASQKMTGYGHVNSIRL